MGRARGKRAKKFKISREDLIKFQKLGGIIIGGILKGGLKDFDISKSMAVIYRHFACNLTQITCTVLQQG